MVNHRLPAAGCDLRDRSGVFRFYAIQDNCDFPLDGCQCKDVDSNIFCHQWTDYKKQAEDCMRHNSVIDERERISGLREAMAVKSRERNIPTGQRPQHSQNAHTKIPQNTYSQMPHYQGDQRPPYQYGPMPIIDGNGPCQEYGPIVEGTCPIPNSRPLNCQCGYKQPCSCGNRAGALRGLTYGHQQCPGPQSLKCRRNTTEPLVGLGHLDMLDSKRPTGKPYFTHDSVRSCPNSQAPGVGSNNFNFQQWMETTENREPPSHLASQCVPSVCAMCGPRYVDCCPNYNDPRNYLVAKQIR